MCSCTQLIEKTFFAFCARQQYNNIIMPSEVEAIVGRSLPLPLSQPWLRLNKDMKEKEGHMATTANFLIAHVVSNQSVQTFHLS